MQLHFCEQKNRSFLSFLNKNSGKWFHQKDCDFFFEEIRVFRSICFHLFIPRVCCVYVAQHSFLIKVISYFDSKLVYFLIIFVFAYFNWSSLHLLSFDLINLLQKEKIDAVKMSYKVKFIQLSIFFTFLFVFTFLVLHVKCEWSDKHLTCFILFVTSLLWAKRYTQFFCSKTLLLPLLTLLTLFSSLSNRFVCSFVFHSFSFRFIE